MKTLSPVLGLGLFCVSAIIAPLSAQAKPLFESSPQVAPQSVQPGQSTQPEQQSLPITSSQSMPEKMAIYRDCIDAHAKLNGTDFKQVNKFCSCVADQTIQGGTSQGSTGALGDCATASSGGGGTMGIIGEVAPSVISGVMEGLSNRSSNSNGGGGLLGGGLLGRGGGLLGGLGDLLGGGNSGGGFNIQNILRGRL
jgi:hypothetical protein